MSSIEHRLERAEQELRRSGRLEPAAGPTRCALCNWPGPVWWRLDRADQNTLDRLQTDLFDVPLEASDEQRANAYRRAAALGHCPRCGPCWGGWRWDQRERDTLAVAWLAHMEGLLAAAGG